MTRYRLRRDDVVLVEDEAGSLQDAAMRAIEVASERSRADRHDYVLDERVGASWRPRITIHPPNRW